MWLCTMDTIIIAQPFFTSSLFAWIRFFIFSCFFRRKNKKKTWHTEMKEQNWQDKWWINNLAFISWTSVFRKIIYLLRVSASVLCPHSSRMMSTTMTVVHFLQKKSHPLFTTKANLNFKTKTITYLCNTNLSHIWAMYEIDNLWMELKNDGYFLWLKQMPAHFVRN